jgi:pyridinium-3,5-biscarboxylic acid mononucleotide sulfurtransferase
MAGDTAALMGSIDGLRASLRELASVVVAFSGGADSALLAWVANDELGPGHALAVTAVSPSLAATDRAHCADLAEAWGLHWIEVETDEMERAAYVVNDGQRCFHCKDALMDAVEPPALARSATVVLGVNLDDLGDHRPGQQAAASRGARFPLVEAGFTKADVRAASRQLGLRTWDRPAAPCLASRLPYGTNVTLGRLRQVEDAEAAVRALGFAELRVRHYGRRARVELAAADLDRGMERADELVAAVKAAGYTTVDIDPLGLRSGNLNEALSREWSTGPP